MEQTRIETIQLKRFNLHLVPSEKFKTITFGLKFKAPLNRQDVTKRAMLPFVLRKGTKNYPTEAKFQEALDDLYGAALSIAAGKGGDYHVLNVYLDVINHKYIENENSLINKAVGLLKEVLFNPLIENNSFKDEIVEREAVTIKQQLHALHDDKMSYSNIRLIEEMYADEPYHIRPQGYEEDLEKVTGENLYEYYQSVLRNDEVDLYVVGDFDRDEIVSLVKDIFEEVNKESIARGKQQSVNKPQGVKEIIENQQVEQSRLHIGYRTNITYEDPDFSALLVFNTVLGGYPGSKLFLNVREKHSLAYYVGSGIDSFKDLLVIFSGIAAENYEQVKEIINEQLQEIRDGKFTDDMINEAKAMLINGYRSSMDSASGMIELLYDQQIGNVDRVPEESIEMINNVSKEDIINVAKKVNEHTIFLLTSEEDR